MTSLPHDEIEVEQPKLTNHNSILETPDRTGDFQSESAKNDNISEANEAIAILLYPPKNKRFKFDEESQIIAVEPIINKNDSPALDSPSLGTECSKSTALEPSQVKNASGKKILTEEECNQNGNNSEQEVKDSTEEVHKENAQPQNLLQFREIFQKSKLGDDCFLKGCKWSPDGTCLLTSSNDNVMRIFDVPQSVLNPPAQPELIEIDVNEQEEIPPSVSSKEGGTVYDFSWYPFMDSTNPVTCVFVSTSQNSPIHLWDAFNGLLRATYQPIDQFDEVTAAYSLSFSPDGSKIYCGFKRCLRIFDISRPGRISEQRNLRKKGGELFQSNIISAIAVNPSLPSIYALGSYDRTVGIYTEPEGEIQCLLRGHTGGVTHLMFSSDGIKLFTGGRKDNEILCWDLRMPGRILFVIPRLVTTNQRVYFDIKGTSLVAGSTNGLIDSYDIRETPTGTENILTPTSSWKAHDSCVNGVHFHPSSPLLASSSGQRQFKMPPSDEENEEKCEHKTDNSVKIWRYESR